MSIALKIDPEDQVVRRNYSFFLTRLKQNDLARIVLKPLFGDVEPEALVPLTTSFILRRNHKYDLAFEYLNDAAAKDPDNAPIRILQIENALVLEKLKFAIRQAGRLLVNYNLSEKQVVDLASLFLKKGHDSEITKLFLLALKSGASPEELAVGYALCKIGGMDEKMEELMPLIEKAGVSVDDIERVAKPLQDALDEDKG